MSFFKEIGEQLGLDWVKLARGYQAVIYDGSAVYIEGIKRIISIESEEVRFLTGGGRIIKVAGEGLDMFDISGGSAIIKGKINYCGEALDEKKKA